MDTDQRTLSQPQETAKPMSGHNKWSKIKHKKGKEDARRGQIFTRVIREMTIAARAGGGNPDANTRLATAILNAKAANMPKDTIERAIKRGTGEIEGASYEEFAYEGYAPGGVALVVEVTTDNRNRTVSDVRHIFTKHGGNLGETGSVAYMFKRIGAITLKKEGLNEDKLMEILLEVGASDYSDSGEEWEIRTELSDLDGIRQALEKQPVEITSARMSMLPTITVPCDAKMAEKVLKMVSALEDCEDVKEVFGNFDIPDEIMEKLEI